ncbi:hypothetical protein [uncultured Gimesia sp.]|uniref:hypothetical protein n=1 Tax=uncultured Gimesia sp. TaxID=1678688 RepID=UPI0030DA8565
METNNKPQTPQPPDEKIDLVYPDLALILSDAEINSEGLRTSTVENITKELESRDHNLTVIEWAIYFACKRNLLISNTIRERKIKSLGRNSREAKGEIVDTDAICATKEFWESWTGNKFSQRQKEIIVLVHGIRTFANWQPMVKKVLEEIPQTEVIPIKYGYFDAFRFWFPLWTRQGCINDIRHQIQEIRSENSDAFISICAHSFGTYAITKILEDNPDFKIHRLVLVGSIVKRSFKWKNVRSQLDTNVINDYGTRDIWPLLAKCLSWGYGDTGRNAFGRNRVKDRKHCYSHSEYFNEEFIRAFWKPWFEHGNFVSEVQKDEKPLSCTSKILNGFISNLSILPLQWIFTVVLFLLISWFVVMHLLHPRGPILSNSSPLEPKPMSFPKEVQDLPIEELIKTLNDESSDTTTRAAALSRLVKAKAIPDRAAMELMMSIMKELSKYWTSTEREQPQINAAIAILNESCSGLLVRKENMSFVLEQAQDPQWNTESPSIDEKHLFTLWFEFFRTAIFRHELEEFEFLNDESYMAQYLKNMNRLMVNLPFDKLQKMINSKVLGFRLIGAIQVLSDCSLRKEKEDCRLQKEEEVITSAVDIVQHTVEATSGKKNAFSLAASVFSTLNGQYVVVGVDREELIQTAWKIVIDEKSHVSRSTIVERTNMRLREGQENVDLFYATVAWLKKACRYKSASVIIEPQIVQFLEKRRISLLTEHPQKVNEHIDSRISACLDILFEMNNAMLPLDQRGRPDLRLQPKTIEEIDLLFSVESKQVGDFRYYKKQWENLKFLILKSEK